MAATATACWRRCAASATGFARRYREDSFLRTEINLVALQLCYAAILIAVSVATLFILYHEILASVASALVTLLTSATPPSAGTITTGLAALRSKDILKLIVIIIATAIIFGYLATRFALTPAKNALAAQKRFIGDIAHELRTPLAVIRTNTEVHLLDNDVTQ